MYERLIGANCDRVDRIAFWQSRTVRVIKLPIFRKVTSGYFSRLT